MNRKPLKKLEREQVYLKYNGHCAYCGKNIAYKDMQVDHLVPVNGWNEKGTNDFDNLMVCNKISKELEFIKKINNAKRNKLQA